MQESLAALESEHQIHVTHTGCVLLGRLFSTVDWTVSPPHQKIRSRASDCDLI